MLRQCPAADASAWHILTGALILSLWWGIPGVATGGSGRRSWCEDSRCWQPLLDSLATTEALQRALSVDLAAWRSEVAAGAQGGHDLAGERRANHGERAQTCFGTLNVQATVDAVPWWCGGRVRQSGAQPHRTLARVGRPQDPPQPGREPVMRVCTNHCQCARASVRGPRSRLCLHALGRCRLVVAGLVELWAKGAAMWSGTGRDRM